MIMTNRAYRSQKFLWWLKGRFRTCQHCGKAGNEAAHPRKKRPWGGGMGQKGSDYGVLIECGPCNAAESFGTNIKWGTYRFLDERDIASLGNLCLYVEEELDPGIDLFAEVLEFAVERVRELET